MSEEMNLYKRCKNIFKAHGVDMGGGGSVVDDDVFVVTFLYSEDGIQCDRTLDEITEAAKDKSVVGLLKMQEGTGVAVQTAVVSTWIPGFAKDFQFCAFNSDAISVVEIDYDDEEDAWTTREFKYEIERTSEE